MKLWNALRKMFGGVSLTKLRSLTIKFDTYKKRLDHTMKKTSKRDVQYDQWIEWFWLCVDRGAKDSSCHLFFAQHWEHMRMHLTHSRNIRNFKDAAWYLELEEDRLASVKVNAQVHYAQGSTSAGISSNSNKRKNQGKGKAKGPKKQKQELKKKARSRNKRKTNVARVRCYNCQ